MVKEETIAYGILGVGAFILLWKSNFFEKIGGGVGDIGTGLGGGLYNIGSGFEGLGYGLGSGFNNIGSGVEWLGKGLYQIGTGTGTLLGGTAPANIIQALKDNPQYYNLPSAFQTPYTQTNQTKVTSTTKSGTIQTTATQQIINSVPMLKTASAVSPLVKPAVYVATKAAPIVNNAQNAFNQAAANYISKRYNDISSIVKKIF